MHVKKCCWLSHSSPIPTHPPYQLNPSSHPGRPTQPQQPALPTHPHRPSITDQVGNSSPAIAQVLPTHPQLMIILIVGYLVCFKVKPTGSDYLYYFGSVIKNISNSYNHLIPSPSTPIGPTNSFPDMGDELTAHLL